MLRTVAGAGAAAAGGGRLWLLPVVPGVVVVAGISWGLRGGGAK